MPTLEEVQAELELKNNELTEVSSKVKEYEEKLGKLPDVESFNQLKTDRDTLKKELSTLKDSIKKGGSDEDKEKLLSEKEEELKRLNNELLTTKEKADKADKLEADIIKELMDQLPDDADIKQIAEGMEIPKLRLYVKKHQAPNSNNTHNGTATGKEINLTEAEKKQAKQMGLSDAAYYEVMQSRKKKE